jgi:hypothetical protein
MPETSSEFTAVATEYAEDREARSLDAIASIADDLGDDHVEGDPATAGTQELAEEIAEPAVAEPDAPAPEEPVDPLKDAVPFTYTVDGAEKAYDGIKLLKDAEGNVQGGVVPTASIKDLQYRLQRGDYLETQNKSLYEQTKAYDAVTFTDRATNTELKGMQAVERYVTENAKLTAAVELLAKTLENPDALAAIYGDPRELQLLTRELGLAARDAEARTRGQFTSRISQAKEQETSTQDRAQVTTQAITGAVQHWASQFPSLTPDDTQKAIAYFAKLGSAIVRPATPDEAKTAGVKPGELVIDHPVIHEYLSDRADLRKQAIASSAAVTNAAKENAARLASATRPKAKATPVPTEQPKAPAKTKAELWAEDRERMLAGLHSSASDDE